MPSHYDETSHAHFLTFGSYHHKRLFAIPGMPDLFCNHLDQARMSCGFQVWAYVVMPDHIHLLVWPGPGWTITEILETVKRPFAIRAVQYLEENFPKAVPGYTHPNGQRRIWQAGGGYDRNIYTEAALRKAMIYIHDNPVRKGMCGAPEEYEWSSARYWLEGTADGFKPDRPPWW